MTSGPPRHSRFFTYKRRERKASFVFMVATVLFSLLSVVIHRQWDYIAHVLALTSVSLNSGTTTLSTFEDLDSQSTGLSPDVGAYRWTIGGSNLMTVNIPFDPTSPQNDFSGNNLAGTHAGGPTFHDEASGECKVGGCLEFDGVDDQLNFGDSAVWDTGTADFTFETWFKTNSGGAIYMKRPLCGHENFFQVLIFNGVGVHAQIDETNTGVGYNPFTVAEPVSDGNWHHVAVVRNEAALLMYLDGNYAGTSVGSKTVSLANGASFIVGNGPCASTRYTGFLDEYHWWNKALTQNQVTQIYQNGLGSSQNASDGVGGPTLISSDTTNTGEVWNLTITPIDDTGAFGTPVTSGNTVTIAAPTATVELNGGTTTLSSYSDLDAQVTGLDEVQGAYTWTVDSAKLFVLNFPFNPGTTQTDYSGNSYDGTRVGALEYVQQASGDCKVGGCMSFDGVNDRIDLSPHVVPLNTLSNATLSVWVSNPAEVSDEDLFSITDSTTTTDIFRVSTGETSATLTDELITVISRINNTDNFYGYTTSTRSELFDGNYHHVAITFDGSDAKIYLDGISRPITVGSGANTGVWSGISNANTVRLGSHITSSGSFFMSGILDEVQLFDRVLSADQVAQLYADGNASLAGPTSIAASETVIGEVWDVDVTRFDSDGTELSVANSGNTVTIAAPSVSVGLNNGTTTLSTYSDLDSQVTGLADPQAAYTWTVDASPYMVANLPFNAGATQNDYSGSTNHGTLVNAPTFHGPSSDNCQVGSCFEFDNTNRYIELPEDDADFDFTDAFTVSAWVNNDAATGYIVTKYDFSGFNSSNTSFLFLVGASGSLRLSVYCNAGTVSTSETVSTGLVSNSSFTHVAGLWEPGSFPRLFIDGVEVPVNVTGSTCATTNSNNIPVRIGKGIDSSGETYFDGIIDEVQIYNRALFVDEISQLYDDGNANLSGPTQIVSAETLAGQVWNLDVTPFESDGSAMTPVSSITQVTIAGPTVGVALNSGAAVVADSADIVSQVTGLGDPRGAYTWTVDAANLMTLNIPFNPGGTQTDYSGNANNGTSVNGPVYHLSGSGNCQVGGCMEFDGVDDHVIFGSEIIPLGEKSIEFWVKSTTQSSPYGTILRNNHSDIGTSGHGDTIIQLTTGEIRYSSNKGVNLDHRFLFDSTSTLDDNTWHHLVYTWDGSTTADGVKLYVDGVLDNTTTADATEVTTADDVLVMGVGRSSGAGIGEPFEGELDEVQIYNRALTAAQVIERYNTGNANLAGPVSIVSAETLPGEVWDLSVTPFESDGTAFSAVESANDVTVNTSPSQPVLVSPADASTVNNPNQTLTALYNDADTGHVGVINFRVSSGSAADCLNNLNIVSSGSSAITATNNENASFAVTPALSDATTYNWCARADDSYETSNGGAFTTMGSFFTDFGNPPNAPVLVSPANASTVTSLTPQLSATYSDPDAGDIGVTQYRVSSGSAADCLSNTNIVFSASSGATLTNNEATTITVSPALTNLATYRWCARNNDGVFTSNSGNYTTMGSFTVNTNPPGGGIGTILRNQPPAPPAPVTPEAPLVDDLDISLLITGIDRQMLPRPTPLDRLMLVSYIIDNPSSVAAENVTANMVLPEHILYVPRSLQVNNVLQTDAADNDAGQANGNGVSVSWALLEPGQAQLVTFQLMFDIEALTQFTRSQSTSAAANPLISLQAVISASNATQTFASNEVIVEPDTSSLQVPEEQPESEPEPEPEPTPEPESEPPSESPSEPESEIPSESPSEQPSGQDNTQTPSQTMPSDIPQTSPSQPGVILEPQTGTEEPSELVITGNAASQNDQISFSGTASEPNAQVIVVINNEFTYTVTSDANGFWQLQVNAEQLGIEPGQAAQFTIEAFAQSSDGRESNRLRQSLFVERADAGEVIVSDIEETVSSNTLVRAIDRITGQVEEVIQANEPEIQTTLAVTAPVVVVSSAPLWGYLPYLPTMFYHFFTWIIGLFGRKKSKEERFYGVVYDSITKEPVPLAIVRIYSLRHSEPAEESSGNEESVVSSPSSEKEKLVSTAVTDKQGRYEALLEPGNYRIEVKKPQYNFPSQIVAGESDAQYQHISHGSLTANDQLRITIPDLPIDPENAPKKWQTGSILQKLWLVLQKAGHLLAVPVLIIGALGAVLTVMASPTSALNWILATLYVLMLAMQLTFRQKPERAWGVVYDVASNDPVPLATLQLIDPEFGKVVKSRLSDYEGRFAFLPDPGKYVVKADKEGYEQTDVVEPGKNRRPLKGEVSIQKEGERISGDVAMTQIS